MNLVEQWQSEFRRLEEPCPWPGPRPLTPAKDAAAPWRFVGRSGEIREFLRAVEDHSLVLLHGESGAGKSSLLNVGLMSVLRRSRFVPLVCNEWHGMRGGAPEAAIATQLADSLDDEVLEVMSEEGLSLIEALDEVHDGRAVLVLDQFEELINADRDNLRAVLEWLLEVNARRRTKVVLSLRSEHLYRLDGLLKAVRPFSLTQVKLAPITDPADIAAVVRSANQGGRTVIEEGAAERLVQAWLSLGPQSPERSLLYLHATLYALFWQASGQGRGTVTESDIDSLHTYADTVRSGGTPAAKLLAAGFDKTIDKKLQLCGQACLVAPAGGVAATAVANTPLVAASREHIRESVEHLSSEGYKVQQELPDLFVLTAERELNLLAAGRTAKEHRLRGAQAKQLVAAITGRPEHPAGDAESGFDLLAASRLELLGQAGITPPPPPDPLPTDRVMAGFGVSPQPWVVDRDDVTAGVLLGRAPWESLVEHVRAFAFAMEWLREASIVRISAPGGTATATLVHDGFGTALKNWASRNALSPLHAVHAFSTFRGSRWSWGASGYFDGGDEWRTVVNVRWRRCEIIDTDFRRVVFVNCDFRATRFLGCRLEGVTFVNCLLDGASFEGCVIVGLGAGHDSAPPPYMPHGLPDFVLEAPQELLADFRRYRDGDAPADGVLYSPTSGVAAVPWARDARPAQAMDALLSPGGLTMLGGRLSSLMLQGCDVSQGGLTLAHIAGSSLDVVEQNRLTMTLSWCAILGLTISDKVDTEDVDGRVSLEAAECVLANTWFGPNLSGTVSITLSQVFALTNLSPQLAVLVDDSAHGGVFNATTTTPPRFGDQTRETEALTLAMFGPYSRRMAYRSRPAEVELVRRAQAMTETENVPGG